jgi:ABC-type branched-subunit amino acid transport system substrate-binding protein
MRMRRATVAVAIGLALSAAGLSACGGDDDNGTTSAAGSTGASPTQSSGGSSTTGAQAGTGAAPAGDKNPIHVALMTWKLPGQDLLTPMTAGANAAAKAINAQGGIGGRKIVIDPCNSALQPAQASTCAHRTLTKHPVAMVGCELTWQGTGLPLYAAAATPSIYCLNSKQEGTNPWAFGINSSLPGENGAAAQYACSLPDVKTMAVVATDQAQSRATTEQYVASWIKKCGKKLTTVYVPPSAPDVTPYVQKAMDAKPQFALISAFQALVPGAFKAFKANGLKPDHLAAADVAYTHSLIEQANGAMDGTVALMQFAPWDDTSDPDVAGYLKATQGSSVDPRDASVEWGYAYIMLLNQIAKQVGPENFNGEAIKQYMSTKNGVHIPMTRTLVNPGPAELPGMKQTWGRVVQWTGTKFQAVPLGPNKDGWFNGF